MNLTQKLLGLSTAAVIGFAGLSFADDAGKSMPHRSLDQRIAELEAKLKDAGAGGVKGSGIKISGYVDTSYTVNLADRGNTGPIAGSSNQNSGRVFDNQYDAFNLNAVKLTIQKDKDSSDFPAGFRVDGIYGEDAKVLKGNKVAGSSSFDSDFYLEQAYINLGVGIGNGIDVKFGKMVTLLGYEVIESAANNQFSRSDGFRLAPLTQTGVTFGYQWNDTVTSTVGVINGLDSLTGATGLGATGSGAINFNTSLGFVGRVDVNGPKTSIGDFSSYVAGLYSDDETSGAATNLNRAKTTEFNIGGIWDKPFEVKELALGIDYLGRGSQNSTAATAATVVNTLGSVSAGALSGYGKWKWTDKYTTSARVGWTDYGNVSGAGGQFGAAGSTLSPLVLQTGATRNGVEEVFSFTLTQAFNVWKDTLVRLEWRRDWTPNSKAGFGATVAGAARDDIRQDQDTIAVNLVYSF